MPAIHQNSYPRRRRASRKPAAGTRARPIALIGLAVLIAAAVAALRGPVAGGISSADAKAMSALGSLHRHGAATRTSASEPNARQLQTAGAAFSSGSCVAFSPTSKSNGRVVFVDAGHGGADPGATGTKSDGTTIYEKDLTLPVAQALSDRLRGDGYAVVMSRTADSTVARMGAADFDGQLLTVDAVHKEAQARTACANAAHADVLVSIHFDSAGDAVTGGSETIYDDARTFSARNRQLALLVQAAVLRSFSAAGWTVPDRGVIADSAVNAPALSPQGAAYGHFLILGPASPGLMNEPSAMPGVIAEPLFVTRPAEADVASSSTGQTAIAAGLESAVNAFFRS